MNDFGIQKRARRKNLLIVEGNHEKNALFPILLRCFPEIEINAGDILIYETNIHVLHRKIVDKYGVDWFEQDVDLPFVVSKEKIPNDMRYKRNYNNIILIFDYERQDTHFDEKTICQMQAYFSDPTDAGKLYLNYPMVESYQHFKSFPDPDFEDLKIPSHIKRGGEYKRQTRDLPMARCINFFTELENKLEKALNIGNKDICHKCAEVLLACSNEMQLEEAIREVISQGNKKDESGKFYLSHLVSERSYVSKGLTYWLYLRNRFCEIIRYNICKANKILGRTYNIEDAIYQETYLQISLKDVLDMQNTVSNNMQTGYIWVLNTCIFFVADYNFHLITTQ